MDENKFSPWLLALGLLGQGLFAILLIRASWRKQETKPPTLPAIKMQCPIYPDSDIFICKGGSLLDYKSDKDYMRAMIRRQNHIATEVAAHLHRCQLEHDKLERTRRGYYGRDLPAGAFDKPPFEGYADPASSRCELPLHGIVYVPAASQRRRLVKRQIAKACCDIIATHVAGSSAIIMNQVFRKTGPDIPQPPGRETQTGCDISSYILDATCRLGAPELLDWKWTGIIAIACYGIAMGVRYYIPADGKRHQDWVIVAACVLGLLAGSLGGMEPQEILFRVLPGLTLGALLLASFIFDTADLVRGQQLS